MCSVPSAYGQHIHSPGNTHTHSAGPSSTLCPSLLNSPLLHFLSPPPVRPPMFYASSLSSFSPPFPPYSPWLPYSLSCPERHRCPRTLTVFLLTQPFLHRRNKQQQSVTSPLQSITILLFELVPPLLASTIEMKNQLLTGPAIPVGIDGHIHAPILLNKK